MKYAAWAVFAFVVGILVDPNCGASIVVAWVLAVAWMFSDDIAKEANTKVGDDLAAVQKELAAAQRLIRELRRHSV